MWVFARESTMAGRLGRGLKASLGLWWLGMGNKGAVGVQLPIRRGDEGGGWETLTYVAKRSSPDCQIRLRSSGSA